MKNYFICYFTKKIKSRIIKVLNNHYNIVKYDKTNFKYSC